LPAKGLLQSNAHRVNFRAFEDDAMKSLGYEALFVKK